MTSNELSQLRESLPPTSTQKSRIRLVNTLTGQDDTFNVSMYRIRCKIAQMEGWGEEKLSNIFVEVFV